MNPQQITNFIMKQKELAMKSITGVNPEEGLEVFCDSMDTLLSAAGFRMGRIHFAAIITTSANIWSQVRHKGIRVHADMYKRRLDILYQRCVQSLHPLLGDMSAWEIGNVVWASATLGLDPDATMPVMSHALTSRFLVLINMPEEKQRPNAYQCANLLRALAAMGPQAVSPEAVEAVTLHIGRLSQNPDEKQRPDAQQCATVLRSLATMGHPAAVTEVVDPVCLHFARLIQHPDASKRPTAQNCSYLLWCLATLGHTAAATKVADQVCSHFAHLTQHPDASLHPTAQNCSYLLWSLATLGHTAAATKVADPVCSHFAHLTQHTDAGQCPNAQSCSNLLWSLVTMGHIAAATKVADPVCLHLARLTQHTDASKRPTAWACAKLLWAVARLEHSAAITKAVHAVSLHFASQAQYPDASKRPDAQACSTALFTLAKLAYKAKRVLDPVCMHFGQLMASSNAKERPDAQAVSNLVWALGTLKHTPADDRLLQSFCAYMHALLQSQDESSRPHAQDIAMTLWALAKLKHAPSHDLVSAMLDRFVLLCKTPGQQPSSQGVNNVFLACSEGGLSVSTTYVEAMLDCLWEMPSSRVDYQDYCNVAWSLAVMKCIDFRTFAILLNKLSAKQNQEYGSKGAYVWLKLAEAMQLYQALSSLKPPLDSEQMEAWSSLRSSLQTIAAEPDVVPVFVLGQPQMCAALDRLGLLYKARVPCGVYTADAVLFSRSSKPAEVVLMLEHPDHFIKSTPSR